MPQSKKEEKMIMKVRSLFSLIVSLSILMKNKPLMGLIVSLVVLGTGCSPVFAQSQQYPTNEELNVLDIAATAGWINTNVYVKRGWRVKISARGKWSNGNYTRSDRTVFRPFYGPDGFSDTSDPTTELLVPTTLAGSLIGQIGNSQPFAIGSNLTFVAANDGWLYLSMNDKPGTFNDNQGSLNVTVQYTSNQTTTARSQNLAQPPKSQLLTWREFIEQGGRRFIQVDYDLPSEFRNGYVYINIGADNNTAYILKQGLSGYPPKLNAITQIDYAVGDRYVKSGNAIKFNWGGGAVYYQRHGRDTEVRFSEKSGQGCLRLTCLEAPFMTNQQITIILHSEREIGQTTTGRTTGQSPSPNQQTATRTIQPVIQTFSSVKSLGMAQFLRGTTELKSAQETLQKAARGEYDTITNGQKTDFLEDILEDIPEIRPVDCKSFGFSCESTEITYADYLNLKLKVYLQIGVFKNGMKVYDEIPKYQNRLFQDQRYGGLNVGQNLTSEWDKRWNNVKEQQRLKDEQANLPITERIGVVMEQTIQDTANFSWELFKTSTKVAATLAQIKDLAETITSLRSINQYNLNRIAGGPKYTIAVEEILKDSGKALQSFDTDKINELALKGAQETIELINAQDRKVAGSANVIKIYLAAKDIIDKNNLLRQPQATNALDDFDKFYIAATM
ncbi:MAG TPA: hypothetical protein DEF27_12895 [Oscillatoriales bacterium UBA8482]|nr:MAG: hypothetical protein AUK43_12880 [Oscillatoriales cyanobacterium CG2_30_40_61]HBW58641.1 hypothetical protein [Oscillatoriales bacterium UBA8482]